ncbi:MAG: DUF3098 domain-containing protein [Paludibacteraceae bacterium]|nr:DUF3098 domain-containing protein [Paludibacteraceae bacterium]
MNQENNSNLRLGKKNLWLIGTGVCIIVIGFALMMGPSSQEGTFEESIFSVRRINVAPVIVFLGYISVIFSILYKPKK